MQLRRRAAARLGEAAHSLFLTRTGLEQATRPSVARWRAGVLAAAGAHRVVDLGCGLGLDARAILAAGLSVVAVERDPVTAVFATANLAGAVPESSGEATAAANLAGGAPESFGEATAGSKLDGAAATSSGVTAEVRCADAVEVAADLLDDADAVFLDPARRTGRGRSWRLADLSPSWEFTREVLRGRPGCAKLGPGFPLNQLPDDLGATWVSESGDLVELTLWSQAAHPAGARRAVLLPAGDELDAGPRREPPLGGLGRYLYEPDPAVIRSGGTAALAELLDARAISAGIAYLSSDSQCPTPFASAFEVLEVMPWEERRLRAWVREHDIGTLEIKLRGLEVDPAELRKRLKLKGKAAATVVLAPCQGEVQLLVVARRA